MEGRRTFSVFVVIPLAIPAVTVTVYVPDEQVTMQSSADTGSPGDITVL